ncbi:MAG: KH domain-containing protein [Coriobacteriia bacterium]|nr:KH domain-containing protein [Coriobacteriia bacterium]
MDTFDRESDITESNDVTEEKLTTTDKTNSNNQSLGNDMSSIYSENTEANNTSNISIDAAEAEIDSDENESSQFNSRELDLSEDELDEIADAVIEVMRTVLFYFNAEDTEIEEYEGEERELIFDVVGENLGMLIGRHGRTLEAMQLLVSAIVSRRIGYHYPIVVDIEGYANRRKQKLISLAKSSAARAIRLKRSVRLRPMSPYERRVVHMALKDDRRVRTESEGLDPNRQVVICLV